MKFTDRYTESIQVLVRLAGGNRGAVNFPSTRPVGWLSTSSYLLHSLHPLLVIFLLPYVTFHHQLLYLASYFSGPCLSLPAPAVLPTSALRRITDTFHRFVLPYQTGLPSTALSTTIHVYPMVGSAKGSFTPLTLSYSRNVPAGSVLIPSLSW